MFQDMVHILMTHFIFSLLYAPLVFILLKFYNVQIIAILLFSTSLIWLFLIKDKKDLMTLFPLFYLFIALCAFVLDTFLFLKMIPLFIAIFYALVILISYFQDGSFIMKFAEKISQNPIDKKEQQYIHHSTLFWFFVSMINVLIHVYLYMNRDLGLWVYYSSFGWYIVFAIAGMFQFLHRHYIFLGKKNV